MKIKGLFMKAGRSLNDVIYTENAVKNMVQQINTLAENVKNKVKGAQYITMNFSHFTDEIDGTVARILSASYIPKEDGGEGYFEAELIEGLPNLDLVKKLIEADSLSHVSIYGYIENFETDARFIKDSDGKIDAVEVNKLKLVRVDFTKNPGVPQAYLQVLASLNNKVKIENGVIIIPEKYLFGGIMQDKEKITEKAKTEVLQEELKNLQAELTETKAKLSEMQEKVSDYTKKLKEQQDILKEAYKNIDGYMKEAFIDELKATKGFSDGIIENVLLPMMEESDFQSKELDTEKRYIEFKEFYKPLVEKVEKIVEEAKNAVKEIKEDAVKEEIKEEAKSEEASDVISYLL